MYSRKGLNIKRVVKWNIQKEPKRMLVPRGSYYTGRGRNGEMKSTEAVPGNACLRL